jgi:hypothetical protein
MNTFAPNFPNFRFQMLVPVPADPDFREGRQIVSVGGTPMAATTSSSG